MRFAIDLKLHIQDTFIVCLSVCLIYITSTDALMQAISESRNPIRQYGNGQQILKPLQASPKTSSPNSRLYFPQPVGPPQNYLQRELVEDRQKDIAAIIRDTLTTDSIHNSTSLNLASMNARTSHEIAADFRAAKMVQHQSNPVDHPSFDERNLQAQPHLLSSPITAERRDDRLIVKDLSDEGSLTRSGSKHPGPWKLSGPLTTSISGSKYGLMDKRKPNCITRSEPLARRCEDHLIRRLYQDAGEGRTVLDVSRRVCCAIFWHKDCISRAILETCPDSSPTASEFLLGSRKQDLTRSCQRFNRDGCNGAMSMSSYEFNLLWMTLPIITLLALSVNFAI